MTSRAKTDDAPIPGTQRWDVSWTDVDRAQLMTMLAATPAQRLAWLEEAMRLAYASGAIRKSCGSHEGHDRSAAPRSPGWTNTGSRPSDEGHEANQGTESSSDNRR